MTDAADPAPPPTLDPSPSRVVHCADGVAWLRRQTLPADHAILTSLPDSSELRRLTFAEWQQWFADAAAAVVSAAAPTSASIFFQTDVRRDGAWIDKAFLVQRAVAATGSRLLWHKIVCRAPAGIATGGRPGYAHLLCFSRAAIEDPRTASADVLPQLGAMSWPRAIGRDAAEFAVRWLRDHVRARVVVDPFCGIGTALAVANANGLGAIGVELAPGRAAKARSLQL